MLVRERLPSSGGVNANRPLMTWKTMYHHTYSCLSRFYPTFQALHWCLWSGLGAVLYQTHEDGTDAVLAYASRSLSKAESHYPAHKLEFFTLKWAVVKKFHEYLYGLTFDVYTDKKPLTYMLTTAKLDATSHCWVASLANYNFQLYYWAGKTNIDADALLRVSWPGCMPDISGTHLRVTAAAVQAVHEAAPQRSCKPHWDLQLQSTCSGCSPWQSAGHMYDLGRLASSPASGSYARSSHL